MTSEPYKTTIAKLADFGQLAGQELGLSEWVTITQERIQQFADATDDHQWIHVDPERAQKESPFQTTIAHGFLVLALASRFAYETYQIEDVSIGINYGLDKVRFPTATPVGAQVRGRVSLIDFRSIPRGARFKLKITFELKDVEKPACVAEFLAVGFTTSQNTTHESS
ncbi:MAG: MaoC family dehydratase [Bacteroidota bacterium]